MKIVQNLLTSEIVPGEDYPSVNVDLMRKALNAFFAAAHRQSDKPGWSTKAGAAVRRAVREADVLTQCVYEKRCHAFRNMIKDGVPKALRIWVLPDGSPHDALIAAVALAPLRNNGKFRIWEFEAVVEKIAKENG